MITVIHVDTERTWRGGEGQVYHLLSGLPAYGVRSIVAAPLKSALMDRARQAGLPAIPLRSTGEISLRQFQDLLKGSRKQNADIFHVHTAHGLISAALVRYWSERRIKVVCSRRTDFHLRTHFLNLSVRKYIWAADKILAVSNTIKNVLISDGIPNDRIETVYSGIDTDAFNPAEDGDPVRTELGIGAGCVTVTMVAALVPHKDPFTFLRAAERLADGFPRVYFLLVGAGDLWDEIRNAIQNSSLKDRFIMTGFRNDIHRILAATDIFCMSSKTEGLCTSILDAMAMARPVVATRAGGIPEVVADSATGYLVPVQDPAALAEKIAVLIGDPERRRIMGDAGRQRVTSMFNMRETVRKTAAVYRELMNETGNRPQ
jgi:L-malate glycosyltransferase